MEGITRRGWLARLGALVPMELQEAAYEYLNTSWALLTEQVHEDPNAAEIARRRLKEIEERPEVVIRGEELAKELEALL